jgi:hypothetical protein
MAMVNRWVDCARRAVLRAGRAAMLTLVRARRLAASGRAILAARIVWVAALAFACLPPLLSPVAFLGGVDTSWQVGLLLAARDHLQWGTQVIWTYGPLGYIDTPIFIFFRQWFIAVTVMVALQMALFIALAVLLSIWRAPLWTWLVMAGVLVCPGTVVQVPDLAGLLLGVLLLVMALEQGANYARSSGLAAAAGLVLAATAMIKSTSLVSGVVLILLFILVAAVHRWRASVLAAGLGFIGGFALLWVVTGQNLQDIPAYVHSTLELASGYSAAMDGGSSSLFTGLGAAIVAATGIGVILLWRQGNRSGFWLMLLLFPVVALEFKEGFVRADVFHETWFFSVVGIAAGVLVAVVASARMGAVGRVGVLSAANIAVGLSASFLLGSGMPMPILNMSATASEYRSAWTLVTDSTARDALESSTSAEARAAYDLSPAVVAGIATRTVDVIPTDIALAYGYGLAWDPRPVLQSYSAYTPYLDESDAAHFASQSAPDDVLFADQAIDGLYPVFQEPATFRALLEHYRLAGAASPTFTLLSRSGAGSSNEAGSGVLQGGPPASAGTVCGPLGEALTVPERPGQYTFASVSIPYSLRGAAKNALYKAADLQIQFTVGAGAPSLTEPYKLTPAIASDGLFVSGYIADQNDLAQVFNGVIDTSIRSLTLTSTNPADYRGTVCASFYTVPLTPHS